MNNKQLSDIVNEAAKRAAFQATLELRNFTGTRGWDQSLANAVSVSYGPDGFNFNIPENYQEAVNNTEYGTEFSRPNAALRQYANSTDNLEKAFVTQFERMLGNL